MELKAFPIIYPPRPGGAIPPSSLDRYIDRGLIAQYKFNDIRALFFIERNGKLSVLSRKREPILSFKIDDEVRSAFDRLKTRHGHRYLIDGGILRTPLAKTGRTGVVIWDLLVSEDNYLVGTTYRERYQLLRKLAGQPKRLERESGECLGLLIGPGLWLAQNFDSDFSARFEKTVRRDRLEGLMLKNPTGKLRWGSQEENNGDWQIRVRKTSGRHVF